MAEDEDKKKDIFARAAEEADKAIAKQKEEIAEKKAENETEAE